MSARKSIATEKETENKEVENKDIEKKETDNKEVENNEVENKDIENKDIENKETEKIEADKENSTDMIAPEAESHDVEEATKGEEQIEQKDTVGFMSLFKILKFPASTGPVFVSKHPVKVWCTTMGVQALIMGFFALCVYHSINQAIIRTFIAIGTSVADGLNNMSKEVLELLQGSIIFYISKIPFVGESFSQAADKYLSANLTLLVSYLSSETNSFLYDLYPAVNLPEGIGFGAGVLASLIGALLTALILKMFLCIAKHPLRSFSEIFSFLAIRSVVNIPIVFVLAIIGLFFPAASIAILPLGLIFGMSYMTAVLFKSTDKRSEDRLVYVFPFIIILLMLISVITIAIEGVATGYSIYMRMSEFFQTLQ